MRIEDIVLEWLHGGEHNPAHDSRASSVDELEFDIEGVRGTELVIRFWYRIPGGLQISKTVYGHDLENLLHLILSKLSDPPVQVGHGT